MLAVLFLAGRFQREDAEATARRGDEMGARERRGEGLDGFRGG